tara:strand:- start:141 stop:1238 length:1098 start_codon:yes stop_codon:yes gene_type:complete
MLRIILLLLALYYSAAWTPIGSVYNLNMINKAIVDDKEYVIWKGEEGKFVVQDDVCIHRLCPLSEGTVLTDKIECAYHGWQFSSNGTCVNIPTSEKLPKVKKLNTYDTLVTGDILWALIDSKQDSDLIKNELLAISATPSITNSDIPYIREVPYSWNFLLENLFDPAHIPFAHNGFQGSRNDAMPIKPRMIKYDKNEIVLEFNDMVNAKKRRGRISYTAPYIFKLSKYEEEKWKNDLTILCVPITTGSSRVFMCYDKRNTPKGVSRELAHKASNTFFNTDDYIVHKQEINVGKGYAYTTPTSSDYSVKLIQKWIEEFYPEWKFQNLEEKTKQQATDNFKNHDKFCKDCYKNGETISWNDDTFRKK